MPSIMKSMNAISRAQALYRAEHSPCEEITPSHWVFVFRICREPGLTQEELARELCLNKSTVARALSYLEGCGFVERRSDERDKRALRLFPTEKMKEILPIMRERAAEWNSLIAEGIPDKEMEIFLSVLQRIEESAVRSASNRDR